MNADEVASARVREADDFLARGAAYSGFVRLGEAWSFVREQVKSASRDTWRELILEKARRVDLSAIADAARESVNRIARILSTGGVYDHYEIILLLTLRIELDSAATLLTEMGQPTIAIPSSLDDDLRSLRSDRKNKSSYATAIAMCRRNWGFPVTSEWLR